MSNDIKVALIGLDTSHAIEFARRMQAPDCPEDQKVEGMGAATCMRFGTPFESEEGLDKRQEQLESWGVHVTTDFDEAVKDCDAVMLEINDPSYHLEYFKRASELGKPIFLDKPLADNVKNGGEICRIAKEEAVRIFSASSLRFVPQLNEACDVMPAPCFVGTYGPLGQAASGSSVVWYGVHAFEMLERAMGRGAASVYSKRDGAGVVVIIEYPNARRGVVELTEKAWIYGGCLRNHKKSVPFVANTTWIYRDLLARVAEFFKGGDCPADLEDALEILGMLDAAERSVQSATAERI